MQLQVHTWSSTAVRIHVRACAQRSSATKTQCNLVFLGFSRSHGDGCRKAMILRLGDLVLIQERCLRIHGNSDIWASFRTHQRHEQTPSKSLVMVSRGAPRQTIFTYSQGQNGLVRARHRNLSALASENMWSPPIVIELLAVLILLQPHMHFSSSTSRHFSREETWVMETHFTTLWNVDLAKKRGSQNTKNPEKQVYGTTFMFLLRSGIIYLSLLRFIINNSECSACEAYNSFTLV